MPWEWTCSVIPCHTCTEWHSWSQRHHWYNTVIEILVQDTTILENNALRVDMLCGTMSHTHRMAQLKPPTSLIQHCDWDTCRGHYDPREQCLENEHALWYHVTHAQNGTVQATNINTTLTGQLLLGLMVHVAVVYSITILSIHLPACLNKNKSARGYPITLVFS